MQFEYRNNINTKKDKKKMLRKITLNSIKAKKKKEIKRTQMDGTETRDLPRIATGYESAMDIF